MTQAERDIKRKTAVLEHAVLSGNVSKTCRYFGISRETIYQWKRAYESAGDEPVVRGSNPNVTFLDQGKRRPPRGKPPFALLDGRFSVRKKMRVVLSTMNGKATTSEIKQRPFEGPCQRPTCA